MKLIDPVPTPAFRDTAAQDRVLSVGAPNARRRWIWALVMALLFAAIGLSIKPIARWFGAERTVAASDLRFSVAAIGTLKRDLTLEGTVVAAESPALYAAAPGIVRFVAKPGERVKVGDLLATLDAPELQSRLNQERATLESQQTEVARARIANRKQALLTQRNVDQARVAERAAQREKERADLAFSKQAMPEVDFRRSQDALESAALTVVHARADQALERESLAFELTAREQTLKRQALLVTDLERQVELLNVRSPVAGLVGNWATTERAQVAQNQALLTVVDLSRLDLELGIPQSSVGELAPGMTVRVTAGAQTLAGELRAISPEIVNGQAAARVSLADTAATTLKQGQRLSAQIVLGEKPNALLVARGPAVGDGSGVIYVVEDGVAVKRRVTLGASSLTQLEISAGLTPGEQVVIAGSERFASADRVLINGL
jgi:HlyD family secretion protein